MCFAGEMRVFYEIIRPIVILLILGRDSDDGMEFLLLYL